jgi:cell division septation protein DedD
MPASTATTLDRSEERATTALYRAAIGPVNADYYLPIVTRFEAANRPGLSWNWAASLYTLNWMAFRGLWRAALVYAATMGGVAILVFQFWDAVEVSVLLVLAVLSLVLPGVIGNALFHAESRKKMAHALSVSSTLAQACARLNRQAGSRRRFIWLALLNVALAGAAAGGYLAFSGAGTLPLAAKKTGEERKLAGVLVTDLAPQPAPAASAIPAPAAPAASSPGLTAPPALASSAPVTVPRPVSPASAPAAPVLPETMPTASTPKASTTVPVATQHFYINVGLFAKDTNARKAHAKLLAAGLAAFTQELNTRKGKRIRVRVGPFDRQSEADAAVEKIHALELDAVVFQQ